MLAYATGTVGTSHEQGLVSAGAIKTKTHVIEVTVETGIDLAIGHARAIESGSGTGPVAESVSVTEIAIAVGGVSVPVRARIGGTYRYRGGVTGRARIGGTDRDKEGVTGRVRSGETSRVSASVRALEKRTRRRGAWKASC